jgi:uncharacterized domain HDIG
MEYLQQKIKDIKNYFVGFFYVITIIIMGILGLFVGQSFVDILKYCILMSIIITILNYVCRLYEIRLLENKFKLGIFLSGYLFSLIMVMLSVKYEVYTVWMLGAVLIAVFIHPYFGLTIHFIFTFLFCALNQPQMEYFAFYLIIGAVMCLLTQFVSNKTTFTYMLIIVGSIHVTLLFIIHNFMYQDSINAKNIYGIISTLVIISLVYLIKKLPEISLLFKNTAVTEKLASEVSVPMPLKAVNGEVEAPTSVEVPVNDVDTVAETDQSKIDHSRLDALLDSDSELMQRLNNYSNVLYKHSVEVGELSARAAKLLGYDERIARAGGLYHEIGRINGENYIEEGIKLATEQRFPEEIIDIIKQHNSKYEKPKSMEAAFVMLSDSVISTIDYVSNMPNKKNVTKEELIDNIFEIRLKKGTLDESGITIQEFRTLKDYFKNL